MKPIKQTVSEELDQYETRRGLVYPAPSLRAARADPGQDLALERYRAHRVIGNQTVYRSIKYETY